MDSDEENKSIKMSVKEDDYFMLLAKLSAQRSKDPVTQVGAVVVNSKKVFLGLGYNGMPRGCSDDDFPWAKDCPDKLENKHLYVCHAEINAIINSSDNVRGGLLYTTLFPCNECTKLIIQYGIREVIYCFDTKFDKFSTKASKKMLDAVGIIYRQFTPEEKIIQFPKKSNS